MPFWRLDIGFTPEGWLTLDVFHVFFLYNSLLASVQQPLSSFYSVPTSGVADSTTDGIRGQTDDANCLVGRFAQGPLPAVGGRQRDGDDIVVAQMPTLSRIRRILQREDLVLTVQVLMFVSSYNDQHFYAELNL
jgi:hypothetical protein